ATTGVPVHYANGHEVAATREGGGRIDLVRADEPYVFVAPTSLSFGLVKPGATVTRSVALSEESTLGQAQVHVHLQQSARGPAPGVPKQGAVPGTLRVRLAVPRNVAKGERTGLGV